jgi:hypothetical protein
MRRLPTIVFGYVLASLAAGYTLALLFLVHVIVRDLLNGRSLDAVALLPPFYLQIGLLSSLSAAMLALMPALLVIAVAEARGLTSVRLYAIAGMVSGVAFAILALALRLLTLPVGSEVGVDGVIVATALTAVYSGFAGMIGGLVYWWIAGRSAGAGRDAAPPATP